VIERVELYHGVAFARLCRGSSGRSVELRQHGEIRSAYIVGERIGMYVKYSTNRLSPWPFSFRRDHQEEIHQLHDECEDAFVTLVCGTDGIVCLGWEEYCWALDSDIGAVEWIKASRRPREKYTLTGSDSHSSFKVGDNEYPSKIFAALG
jgi:hypothetical protein